MIDDEDIELGQRNLRLIKLTEQHCVHAEIQKSPHFGQGMLEQVTGLPLDGREIRCRYASTPSSASMNLEPVLVNFYRDNCVGCPHRNPLGIPNLATVVGEIDNEQKRAAERAERKAKVEEAARERRRKEREVAVKEEPPATKEWVALLDGLDQESIDEAMADQFVDVAKAGPEICTMPACDVVVSTALAISDARITEVVGLLNNASLISDESALEVALNQLAQERNEMAIATVYRLRGLLSNSQTETLIRPAIFLASPDYNDPFSSRKSDLRLLEVVADASLPGLLDELQALICSDEKHVRGPASGAAGHLFELLPGTVEFLVPKLLEAINLPGSDEPFAGSPREGIQDGLQAAFVFNPTLVSELVLTKAHATSEDSLGELVAVFDSVIRDHMDDEVPEPAGGIAVDALFELVSGSCGENAAASAAESIELATQYHPGLLAGRSPGLVGAVMSAVSTQVESPSSLPSQLSHFMQLGRENARRRRVQCLIEAIGRLSRRYPEEVFDELIVVLSAPLPPGDEAINMRREFTRTLGHLGSQPSLLPRVLPLLFSALAGDDQGVRAAAVQAWAELERSPQFKAPTELEDLLPALISDRYVIVHQAVVRALAWDLDVPARHRDFVMLSLLQIAQLNIANRSELDESIKAGWRVSGLFNEDPRLAIRQRLLGFASNLGGYATLRILERAKGLEKELPEFADRVLQVLTGPENMHERSEEVTLRLLRDLPTDFIRERSSQVVEAGIAELPRWYENAAEFVEILETAGCWEEAKSLAEITVKSIPNDPEHEVALARSKTVLAQVDLEIAIGTGDAHSAGRAVTRWEEADQAREVARAKQKSPFGVDDLG